MRRKVAGWLLIIWVLLLLSGSLMPFGFKVRLHTTANNQVLHPLIHVLSFAGVSFLASFLARTWAQCGLVLVGVALLGVVVEWLEFLVYRQGGVEVRDMWIDGLGALVGLVFFAYKSSFGEG